MPLTKIDSYQIMFSSNSFRPRIWLKSGSTFIGQLHFYPLGSALPPDSSVPGNTNLHYHIDKYASCLDILRNESPVSLLYVGSGGSFENGLQTGVEIVGEGE